MWSTGKSCSGTTCEVEGAVLADGGFESRHRTGPGWQSGGGTVVAQSADVPAVEGTHYARTWHNQTLFTTFNVVGGQPVTDPPARPGGPRRRHCTI